MPTYDYACGSCGHQHERFEPMSDDGPKICPKCERRDARRRLGMGSGAFVNGGFPSPRPPPRRG
jgi:putative FmdB family regulatory protein